MKRVFYILNTLAVAALFGVLSPSCEEADDEDGVIRIGTRMTPNANASINPNISDNTFMLLFWYPSKPEELDSYLAFLEKPEDRDPASPWPLPYLAAHAPQPIGFYEYTLFDTRRFYPSNTNYLYATGYSPGEILKPASTLYLLDYRRLEANMLGIESEKGLYDFMSCDVWRDVYRGCMNDPFAQDKNKLYFRHLSSKLVIYAERDEQTMENKQFVRNVVVTNLYMSIDGGKTYTAMHTPDAFEWKSLDDGDYTRGYNAAIQAVKAEPGNATVTTVPLAGYKAVRTTEFAGSNAAFRLEKHATDRVPINGMTIDSCYVSNPIVDGVIQTNQPIMLKMNVEAELSFDPDFPMGDGTGSDPNALTYTHTWQDMVVEAFYQVDEAGKATPTKLYKFKPGMEYRVYLKFHRKGVNAVALELPWDVGGVHYITISGGKR